MQARAATGTTSKAATVHASPQDPAPSIFQPVQMPPTDVYVASLKKESPSFCALLKPNC